MNPGQRLPALDVVAWLELTTVLLIAPFLLLPGRIIGLAWHPVLFGLLVLLRLVHIAVQRASVRAPARTSWLTTPLDVAVLVLLATLLLGMWVSVDKAASLEIAGYIFLGIALYFALVNWPPAKRMPLLDFIMLMSAGGALLLIGFGANAHASEVASGIISPFFLSHLPQTASALFERLDEVVNINVLLTVAALLWPFTLALALVWRRDRFWWTPLLGVVGSVFLLMLMLEGGSRGSLLASAVATMVVLFVRWPRALYVMIAIVPFVIVVALRNATSASLQFELYRVLSIGGLSGRREIWLRALVALEDFGYTGIGIGLFGKAIPMLYPYDLLQHVDFPHAHNLFLQVGLDLGIIGLVAYTSLWIIVLLLIIGVLRAAEKPTRRFLALGATGAVAAMFVLGMVDVGMWGTKLTFMPWILFALIVHLAEPTDVRAPNSAQSQ